MTISAAAVSAPAAAEHPTRAMLLVAALGMVFGDIGTSPIYAFRESLRASGNVAAKETIFGILSLVFWTVVLVVALKYVVFVMRADNQGEGGTMALISLVLPAAGSLRTVILAIGLGGASLFFGDAMITPAISVLSAIEGLQIATLQLATACSLRWNCRNPEARSHVTIKQTSREPTKPRLRLPLALLISLSR